MTPRRLGLLAALTAVLGCSEGEPKVDTAAPRAVLTDVSTRERGRLSEIGGDTLSDSARVLRVLPEPDGSSVAYLFADPMRAVSAGLAIMQEGATRAQLVWPDSVTTVRWTGPGTLAFTTSSGTGANERVVLDVHAESISVSAVVDSSRRPAAAPAAPRADDAAVRARATRYIDSLHVQPQGQPQNSALRYRVLSVLASPDGELAVFYVAADDGTGTRVNPAWYAIDPRQGRVFRLDQVVGPAAEMPEEGAGWTETGRFLYAKGLALWEGQFSRRTP